MLLKEYQLRKIIRKAILVEIAPAKMQFDGSPNKIDGQYSLGKKFFPLEVPYDHPYRDEIGGDMYNMVYNNYDATKLGKHFKIGSPKDLEKNYGSGREGGTWIVGDVDADPQIDYMLAGKIDPGIPGVALGAAGSDGTRAGKSAMKTQMSNEIKAGKWWGAASGKIAVSMINSGTPSIQDEKTIRMYENDPQLEYFGEFPYGPDFVDDAGMTIGPAHPFRKRHGWFARYWNGEEHLKLLFAKPPSGILEKN